MNGLLKKQVSIRLAEDGTGFIYTVKYGRFTVASRQVRLARDSDNQPEAGGHVGRPGTGGNVSSRYGPESTI